VRHWVGAGEAFGTGTIGAGIAGGVATELAAVGAGRGTLATFVCGAKDSPDLGAPSRVAGLGLGLAGTVGRELARGGGRPTDGDGFTRGCGLLAGVAGVSPDGVDSAVGGAITAGLSASTGPCGRARGDAEGLGRR
jgi:hypothetical protein